MKLDVDALIGQHCETTATGTLLKQIGIELSEPMLFGLGEGLSFLFWNMKTMDFPFLGGRVKPDVLTENIARNLGLSLEVKETTSGRKAWNSVKELIDSGVSVGLKLDCFHLEYFSQPFHFAGHYVAMYGYDDQYAYFVDTAQQGSKVKTSLESLAKARAEKGPMSSRNLFYRISVSDKQYDLKKAIAEAVRSNAKAFLNPPIRNVSYLGIEKTSKEVIKWFERSKDVPGDFKTCAMLMEKAGTGGALFRNLYRDFLKEAHLVSSDDQFKRGYEDFCAIAEHWSQVIKLFETIATTQERKYADEVSELFQVLAVAERQAMERLAG
jgi:hypothetical protein